MDGGFPYGDIIVIGVIAAFILLRYRAMLGEQRGRDEPPMRNATPISELERVIQLPSSRIANATEKKEDFLSHGALADTYVAMRAIDREFAPDDFLRGARMAYEMILDAFTKRNRDTLKMLLSPEIYQSFDQHLKDEETAKRFNDTTLVAITKAEVKSATLKGSQATIAVDFTSEQIHLVRDENRTILEGNPSQQDTVEDSWVFTRDLKNPNPNWTVVET